MDTQNLIICLGFMLLTVAFIGLGLGRWYLSTGWLKPETLKAQIDNRPLQSIRVCDDKGVWTEKNIQMDAEEFMAFIIAARKAHILAWTAFGSVALVCSTFVACIALSLNSTSAEPTKRDGRENAVAGKAENVAVRNPTSVGSNPVTPSPVKVSLTIPAISAQNGAQDSKTP